MARTPTKKPAQTAADTPPGADEQPATAPDEPTDEQPANVADEPTEEPTADHPASDSGDQAERPQDADAEPDGSEQLSPGVYEYVAGIGCVYPHVPLTCRAFHPAVEETESTPAVPEQAATVFEWLDGPPADGRWAPTEKPPTQVADNAGGLLNGKE